MNVRSQTDVLRLPFVLTRPVHSNVTVEKGFRSTPLADHAKIFTSVAFNIMFATRLPCVSTQLDPTAVDVTTDTLVTAK